MTRSPAEIRRRGWLALGWIAWIALALAARFAGPDGQNRAELGRFLGRFHPVIVHLPIALMLLVPVLELAGRTPARPHLRSAAGFVLGLTAAAALVVAFDGWLLARTGAYRGHLVDRHMWGGVMFSALCLVAATLRGPAAARLRPGTGCTYAVCLAACVVVLTWTGHEGGALTHGDGFLTSEMPPRLRAWLHLGRPPVLHAPPEPPGLAGTLYSARIQPIFEHSCIACHGPRKMKGGLRMDTYANLMQGGEDGTVVESWFPDDSDLVRRITLPPSDDDFMPNNGKNILTPAQVKLIESWIAAGASDREPADAVP
ncbi:MAG: c-type cytochrome domain-containing protein [Opitutaceae bacterium]